MLADSFGCTASGTIPPGTVVVCTLFVHTDSDEHNWKFPVSIQVGIPENPPGTIIWGPRVCPGMPTAYGLYGLTYNTSDDKLYCCYFMSPTIYVYSSDSLLTQQGTITAPQDSCTDIDYCTYDNTFWIVANPQKTVYKITPTGAVLRSFTIPFVDYPVGITEHEAEHRLYISDRRNPGVYEQRVFVTDTLGSVLDTIIHPLAANYGTRCLALDPGNPADPPSLLNMYTWFDAAGTTLDSSCVYEMDRHSGAILNGFKFTTTGWNMRGIEYDRRDASYWVTIMQYSSGSNNMILKVAGFNPPVEVTERPSLPGRRGPRLFSRPNPFTATTTFHTAELAPQFSLTIYDNAGRLVRSCPASSLSLTWDGRDQHGRAVAPGVYFCRAVSSGDEAWAMVVRSR